MQVAPSGGQICNLCKWCHVVLVTESISGSVVPLAMFNMYTMATRVPVGAKKVKQKGLLWCLSVLPISGFQLSAPLTHHHHHHQTSYLSFSQHYHGSVDFNTVGMYFMTHHHHHGTTLTTKPRICHCFYSTSYHLIFVFTKPNICFYKTKY